jgi:hypothetical protein
MWPASCQPRHHECVEDEREADQPLPAAQMAEISQPERVRPAALKSRSTRSGRRRATGWRRTSSWHAASVSPCSGLGGARSGPGAAGIQATIHSRRRTTPPDAQSRVLADPARTRDLDGQTCASRQRSFKTVDVRNGGGPRPPPRRAAPAGASDHDPDATRRADREQADVDTPGREATAHAHHRERAEQWRRGLGPEHSSG